MYGMVLMTAMTAAPDAPQFNGYFRDLLFGNCSGCAGYTAPRYNCGGSNYPAGCSGSFYNGCNGCNGDTFLNRVRRFFDRGDCCGGAGSGYGFGCSGARYGCGAASAYSCFGSAAYSCFGGPAVSYTPVFNGGQSCYGGPVPSAPPPVFDSFPTTPGGPPPTIPYAPPEVAPAGNLNTAARPPAGNPALVSNSNAPARAIVVVRLPADARLFADARQLTLTGAERKFVTPDLPPNQDFTYRFRVEYERDGETLSVTRKVPVRAGGSVTIEFSDLTAKSAPEAGPAVGGGAVAVTPVARPAETPEPKTAAPAPGAPAVPAAPTALTSPGAAERATITVKLPPGATLYVDDRKSPSAEPVRQFSTPPLPAGRDFAYLMKAELVRNGQTETFTQKVPFRAGERVEVDFTAVGR